MQYLGSYHYLAAGLALFGLAGFTVVVLRRQWPLLSLSGLFAVPSALYSYEFIPAYWNPRVLFHFVTSLEDILFSVSVGIICMFTALRPYANRVSCRIDYRIIAKRYFLVSVVFLGVWVVLRMFFSELVFVMPLALAMIIMLGIVLMMFRRDLFVFSVRSGFSFATFYLCVLLSIKLLQPAFFDSWNPAAQLSISVYGIPTFELLWALVYGSVWPLYVAFLCDLQIDRKPNATCFGLQVTSQDTLRTTANREALAAVSVVLPIRSIRCDGNCIREEVRTQVEFPSAESDCRLAASTVPAIVRKGV